jgi:23S rRNA (cytosine1962-C5)-methyltransferase
MDIESILLKAWAARKPLLRSGKLTACRLFHGAGDGVDGLVVELLNDVLVVQTHPGHGLPADERLRPAIDRLRLEVGARAVYHKIFVSDRAQAPADIAAMHADAKPWIGETVEAEIVVREDGMQFVTRPYDGFSVGLFLEHRDNRQRVWSLSAGRRVLNLFSYTCSFSVAAAMGGAAHVSSVDASKHYLEWGKHNFEINGVSTVGHTFFCSDTIEFYDRARRQSRRYDLVILDPPTFSRLRRPRRTLVQDERLAALVTGAVELLDPGGILLLATNCRQIGLSRLEREIRTAAGSRGCTIIERPPLSADFPGDADYSKTVIAKIGQSIPI